MPHDATESALPLAGITVLDLTRALAGPYATAILSDLGATITKVESIKGGDSTRGWPPFDGDHSLYYDSTNRGKSSIAVDFYSEEGRALLKRMALASDVVIENFRPGVMADLGLDPDALLAEKPGLVVASVSGFGATGPLSQTAGLDQVAQGMSGLMSVTGKDADNLYRVGIPVIDIFSGLFTTVGILASLLDRERTGRGHTVATSLLEAALAISVFQGQRFLSTGVVPEPQGNDHPVLAPYGVFATADIPIIIAVGNEKQWRDLCGLVGDASLAEDPQLATGKLRTAHRGQLKDRLEALLVARQGIEWVELFRAARIPTGPIYTFGQVFEDAQVKHLDMVQHVTRADGSDLPLLRGPISIDGAAPRIRKAPPALGEDTRAVLEELGLTDAQVQGLVDAGVVSAREDSGA
ncbi:crotonobetainyl-CoA:carnitine CoA-transferase CaiB-like acyl-CoA transferase [Cryobacterium mesophilum]|uniref:CoA transferase n=1 Tax=Terrimesophilobacter mesophilus TaxID=433647 RepID=A0A4R8V8P2_9MICO|nr:CoA transferase [Terrimesophilobacter mesophilus]MBB5632708.1 crotonobetainyl-CoA:carnitine CoA-transferase CaiB-like acyl-CoA transferase [Terrimesophilobacter mesophilus]TFB79511.1 CoA transferase [Terrimesophilobacter mesophilus]